MLDRFSSTVNERLITLRRWSGRYQLIELGPVNYLVWPCPHTRTSSSGILLFKLKRFLESENLRVIHTDGLSTVLFVRSVCVGVELSLDWMGVRLTGWLVGSTWRTRARRRARKGKKDLLIMSDAMDVHAYVCVIMFIDKGLLRLNRDSANEWVSAWLDTEESPAKQVCSRRRNGQNQSSEGGGKGGGRKGSKGCVGGDGRTLRIYRGEFQRCTINRFF